MNIGLDFDGTITSEPTGFSVFVNHMRLVAKHKVYIVTMRYPSECISDPMMQRWALGVDGIVATSRQAKKPVMESLGIPIHIWIDDNPEAILQGAESIWPNTAKEGEIVIPDHISGELKLVSLKDMNSSVRKGECAVSKKLISRDTLHFKHNQS